MSNLDNVYMSLRNAVAQENDIREKKDKNMQNLRFLKDIKKDYDSLNKALQESDEKRKKTRSDLLSCLRSYGMTAIIVHGVLAIMHLMPITPVAFFFLIVFHAGFVSFMYGKRIKKYYKHVNEYNKLLELSSCYDEYTRKLNLEVLIDKVKDLIEKQNLQLRDLEQYIDKTSVILDSEEEKMANEILSNHGIMASITLDGDIKKKMLIGDTNNGNNE